MSKSYALLTNLNLNHTVYWMAIWKVSFQIITIHYRELPEILKGYF